MKKKLLPDGYRCVAPTEKIKKGDYMTSKSNLTKYRMRDEQTLLGNTGGWLNASNWIGYTPLRVAAIRNCLTFITPIKPKSVESSHSSAEQSGTVSANVTPVE